MKKSKLILSSFILTAIFFSLCPHHVSAQEFAQESAEKSEEKSPLELSLALGTAWYPESKHSTKGGTHFSPLNGAFEAAELAVTGEASYTIPFMQIDNMLMEDNHITLTANLQLSPATLNPTFELTFSPLAVLELTAGFSSGTGWYFPLADVQGAGEYNSKKIRYETISPFKQWYLNAYGCVTLMFDTGAVWEGDWHHIVMSASYTAGYQKFTGTDEVWQWKANSYPMANGWIYEQDYFLGYQMPLALSLVGIDLNLSGHYKSSDFDSSHIAESYSGDFIQIDITPVAQINFDKKGKNSLGLYACISSRRSFSEKWKDWDSEPLLTKNGREFFFESLGFQIKHIF